MHAWQEEDFESCMDHEKKRFEKENDGCCSCDVGALYQDSCPNSKPSSWTDIDDKKRRKPGGWYWLGGVCWQVSRGIQRFGSLVVSGDVRSLLEPNVQGVDGKDPENTGDPMCGYKYHQVGVGGALTCWANEATYGRGAGYPWEFGDALNNDGMLKRCEKDLGKDGCEMWGAIAYPKCKKGYHNDACCFCSINATWSFVPPSMAKKSWVTTKAKRSFVPRTIAKQSYTPYSWGMSTYPMVRVKNSFVPVTRTRRAYTPPSRFKDYTSNDSYTIGKERNSWWWDKFKNQSGAEKCCMQGCSDAGGEFSKGCVRKSKPKHTSIKRDQEPYQYPPLCRTVWTPGKPHASPFADTGALDFDSNTGLTKGAIKAWGESCGKHFIGTDSSTDNAWCMESIVDVSPVKFSGMCHYPGANTGTLVAPKTDENPKRYPQLSMENCTQTYRSVPNRKCFGEVLASTQQSSIAQCTAYVEYMRGYQFVDGSCTTYKTADDKVPFGVRKDPQTTDVSCAVKGVWVQDIRRAADATIGNVIPNVTELGNVEGWTRSDRKSILLPYAIPRSVQAGGKSRDIYIFLNDVVDVWKTNQWVPETKKRIFRTKLRSDVYDTFNNQGCGHLGRGDASTTAKTFDACQTWCSDSKNCVAFEFDRVTSTCVPMISGMQLAEKYDVNGTIANINTSCSVMRNPSVVRSDNNETIGFEVLLEEATAPPDWWSGEVSSVPKLASDLYLRDTINELQFGDVHVPLPISVHVNPGSASN